ncbi:hypothetical protein NDU88_007194 [Pleurodeles waltl]|uniref:Uncharacterized protein n=1 Tax=Pleurodeles waltl TaxID=8319 RepID=A0AAV7P065_PLEWA|nr:hypothetical protein NDU88_007194 [Pleurodeles waltl]
MEPCARPGCKHREESLAHREAVAGGVEGRAQRPQTWQRVVFCAGGRQRGPSGARLWRETGSGVEQKEAQIV